MRFVRDEGDDMAQWEDDAKAEKPINMNFAGSLVERKRGATPEVTRALIGMLLRGESFNATPVLPKLDDPDVETTTPGFAPSVAADDSDDDDAEPD